MVILQNVHVFRLAPFCNESLLYMPIVCTTNYDLQRTFFMYIHICVDFNVICKVVNQNRLNLWWKKIHLRPQIWLCNLIAFQIWRKSSYPYTYYLRVCITQNTRKVTDTHTLPWIRNAPLFVSAHISENKTTRSMQML